MVIALASFGILVVLWFMFSNRSPFQHRQDAISEQLRSLLMARTNGSINEEEFQQRQASLHAALLAPKPVRNNKGWGWALIAIIIVTTVGISTWRAKPDAIDTLDVIQPAGPMDTHVGTTPPTQKKIGGDFNVVVKRLADKMAKNPGDGEGWLLLARTYTEMNQMKEASSAYAKAAAILPPNAAVFADWANAHVMANDGKWDVEAKKIIQRALAADAKHLKTLSLAGSEAFSRADYKTAIAYWKKMLAAAEADSPDAKLAAASIQEAEARLSGKTTAVPPAPSVASISGTVTLDARLKGQAAPTDTLFIVARAPDGSNPPLAVKRFTVSDLPVHFNLDDSAAMIPSRTLSQYSEVTLIARISKSGQATPAPGDIEAKPVSAKMGNTEVKLNLSSVR